MKSENLNSPGATKVTSYRGAIARISTTKSKSLTRWQLRAYAVVTNPVFRVSAPERTSRHQTKVQFQNRRGEGSRRQRLPIRPFAWNCDLSAR
jgi:hypothetical protein